jgi:TM2 domain-containing membrane protein YozV
MSESKPSAPTKNTSLATAPIQSVKTAYALLIIGFTGAHRFYVGKWVSGALYLCLTNFWLVLPFPGMVGYLLLALLLFDAIFLRKMVARRNEQIALNFDLHPEQYVIEDDENIAPWARGRRKKTGLSIGKHISKLPLLLDYSRADWHSRSTIQVTGAIDYSNRNISIDRASRLAGPETCTLPSSTGNTRCWASIGTCCKFARALLGERTQNQIRLQAAISPGKNPIQTLLGACRHYRSNSDNRRSDYI